MASYIYILLEEGIGAIQRKQHGDDEDDDVCIWENLEKLKMD